MINGVFERFNLKVGESRERGQVKLSAFELKMANDPLYNLRCIRDGASFMQVRDGQYVRLVVDKEVMMSDTHMERFTNGEFVRRAKGRVLIAELGIGLILQAIKEKIDLGIIAEVWVVEKSLNVADLVTPYFKDVPFKLIVADIFDWRPGVGEKFDTIYFDIWSTISEDNLAEMTKLHNAFKHSKASGGWMGSWMQDWLRRERRRSRSRYY